MHYFEIIRIIKDYKKEITRKQIQEIYEAELGHDLNVNIILRVLRKVRKHKDIFFRINNRKITREFVYKYVGE